MAMIGSGGERVGKRCRWSSSSDSRPCFLAYGGRGPVLYSVNFVDEKTYKKRKFCRRCCIDIHDGDEESKDGKAELDEGGLRLLTPLKSKKSSWFPSCSIVVALGSVVYALGGMIKWPNKKFEVIYSRECFYFDTNRPKGGWIRGPHMLNGRDGGKAVAVEGKIYVFGGVDLDYAPEPWAEVFDPINKKWEALPRPPDELEDCMVLQAAAYGGPLEEKKIMVGGSSKYVYHLNSSSWEYLRNIHLNNCHENIIGAGNFMYWTDMGYLCVVNMESGSYYGGEIKGYRIGKYRDRYECEPTLLHLGGKKFCLLTLHDVRGGRWGDRCKIRCAKFEVSKLIDGLKNLEDNLIASIVCRDTYIVDQSLGCWHGHWHGLVLRLFLHWTHMGMLCVFNMKSGRYYYGLIKGDFIGKYQHWSDPEPTLLHLGGNKFCLLTLDFIGEDRMKICCSKLQVSKLICGLNKDKGTLEASIVCHATYIVDQPLSSWHGLVL